MLTRYPEPLPAITETYQKQKNQQNYYIIADTFQKLKHTDKIPNTQISFFFVNSSYQGVVKQVILQLRGTELDRSRSKLTKMFPV